MSAKPRLVHRPRFPERAATEWQQFAENPAEPDDTREQERVSPMVPRTTDPMREVQMENVRPLRLRLLLEVERTRSISAAAQACGIGQPSASMHLRHLEATLGQQLVSRHGRGSSLTAAGKIVASHAARMLATLDSMRRAVDALGAHGGGELKVAASLTPSAVVVPSILTELCDRYPGVSVTVRTLSSDAVAREVARGEADVGIAGELPTAELVERRPVTVDELVGIAPPGLFTIDGGWITLGQLAPNRLLLGPHGSSTRTVAERCLARAGYRPVPVWEFNSYDTLTRAVVQGVGVGFISRLLVRDEIARGELAAFRVSGVEQMLRQIHALRHPAREPTPEATAFLTLLSEARWPAAAEHSISGRRAQAACWAFRSPDSGTEPSGNRISAIVQSDKPITAN